MKPSRLLLLLALALSSLGLADDTQERDDTAPTAGSLRPLDVVGSSVSRVLATVRSPAAVSGSGDRWADIRRVVHALFDFNEIARRALGQHWKDLLPQEQEEFVRLFTDVLTQSFLTIVERYSGENLAFLGEDVTEGYARVQSRTMPTQGAGISIEYRLLESGSRWAVYDIVFEGVSLVSNYRSQFNSIIGTSSAAQLLQRMRTPRSERTQSGSTVESSTAHQLEPPVRGPLAAGLLVLQAASYTRRR
jgi:phospholipid transport system substrate-binding protein